jgi:hypothetical protein
MIKQKEKEEQIQIAKGKAKSVWEALKSSNSSNPNPIEKIELNTTKEDLKLPQTSPVQTPPQTLLNSPSIQPKPPGTPVSSPSVPGRSRFSFTLNEELIQSAQLIKQSLSPVETKKEEVEFAGEKILVSEKKKDNLSDIISSLNNKPKKISTITKSKLDWDEFKEQQGISDDLAHHNKDGFVVFC